MKISNIDSFPHPVLRSYPQDYGEEVFESEIESSENIKTGDLKIRCQLKVGEKNILNLIKTKQALYVVSVSCLETYWSDLQPLLQPEGELQFDKGKLSGTVDILPLIVLQNNTDNFYSPSWHPEFGTNPISLDQGALLAIGNIHRVNVGREKLAPIESIFSVAKRDSVAEYCFEVDLEPEKITICANESTYNYINRLRNDGEGRNILLNGVYHPVLMEVLHNISQEPEEYQERRWFKVLSAKCIHLGINIEDPDLLADSQRLLKQPFSRLLSLPGMLD